MNDIQYHALKLSFLRVWEEGQRARHSELVLAHMLREAGLLISKEIATNHRVGDGFDARGEALFKFCEELGRALSEVEGR